MATALRSRTEWVRRLRAGATRDISALEKARRRSETERVLAFRDRLRSIAPDTTGAYIDEVREEQGRV